MAESGLVKAKEYDWKDSNVALFGSDLDRGTSTLLVLFLDNSRIIISALSQLYEVNNALQLLTTPP